MNNEELRMKNEIIKKYLKMILERKIMKLCLIIFFCSSISIQTQSVDSLIREAIANNPYLKSIQNKIKAAELRSEAVSILPPPSLAFEFTDIEFGEIDIYNKSLSNNLSISQMFPVGGKLSAMQEVEKKFKNVEVNNFESYKLNLAAQVRMQYFTLWQLDRKMDIQNETNFILNNLFKSTETLFQSNKISQADFLIIKSEVLSNETNLLIYEKQRYSEIIKLNKLLGRDLNSKDIFVEKEFRYDSLLLTQFNLEEKLSKENPELLKMNSMIEMNKAMIDANSRELIPDLMLQAMLMRMPQGMILTSNIPVHNILPTNKAEYMYSLMASITIPFAPWSINKFKLKEEELSAGIKSIEFEKLDMQREMISKLNDALVKYNSAVDLIKLYSEKVIPLYSQSIELQIISYQNNRINISIVIEAIKMLLMQKMNLVMAQMNLQMAFAEIEMMIGPNLKNEP